MEAVVSSPAATSPQTVTDSVVAQRKARWLVFGTAYLLAVLFAAFTQHAWEDYYITYRVSKNLATGHGMVYTLGEKVHTFTSPLNTLIPAALNVMTGNTSDALVLWLFRLLSAGLFAGAAVLLYEIARKNSFSRVGAAVLLGMFMLDAKIVDFSINGQEVGFMMFFLALAMHALMVRTKWSTLKLGLAWTGLMWTRPDGFVYFGAIAAGFFLFERGSSTGASTLHAPRFTLHASQITLLKTFLAAGLITTILYLPWVLSAWHYFGSPIPHTIIAKSEGHHIFSLPPGSSLPVRLFLKIVPNSVGDTFLPAYALGFGGWHWSVVIFARLLAMACVAYWLLPFAPPPARAMSFAFMLGHLYLSYATPLCFPWYVPSVGIMGIFVIAQMVDQGWKHAVSLSEREAVKSRRWLWQMRGLAAVVLFVTAVLFLCAAWQLRIQEREIENGMRKEIGLWLKQQAVSPKESVFLEPLGYIGFFSQMKMLDTPGLCSDEVVAAERKVEDDRNWVCHSGAAA